MASSLWHNRQIRRRRAGHSRGNLSFDLLCDAGSSSQLYLCHTSALESHFGRDSHGVDVVQCVMGGVLAVLYGWHIMLSLGMLTAEGLRRHRDKAVVACGLLFGNALMVGHGTDPLPSHTLPSELAGKVHVSASDNNGQRMPQADARWRCLLLHGPSFRPRFWVALPFSLPRQQLRCYRPRTVRTLANPSGCHIYYCKFPISSRFERRT